MKKKNTPDQIAAGNQYHAYNRGWRDGAHCKAHDRAFSEPGAFPEHAREAIVQEYNCGYEDAFHALCKAQAKARKRLRYQPTILRAL